MSTTYTAERLEVSITDPRQLHELLNEAEMALRQRPQRCAGILVTRHDPGRYTLTLSDAVPFGETHEHNLA